MKEKTHIIAVVGATGNTGHGILQLLEERAFPIGKVHALASRESLGKRVSFGETKELTIEALELFDFAPVDLAFFAAGRAVSERYVPKAVEKGAIVIDLSAHFLAEVRGTLLVPEVNPEAIDLADITKILLSPHAIVVPVVMALKSLQSVAKIRHVSVVAYQSVSAAGRAGMDELFQQTKQKYLYQDASPEVFSHSIAFNVIPDMDELRQQGQQQGQQQGYSSEESILMQETQEILGGGFTISATIAHVPVFIGNSLALEVEFEADVSLQAIHEALGDFPGITVLRPDVSHMTPVEVVGEDAVFISRVRGVPHQPSRVALWIVADNMRKGTALNAVQIAELLEKEGFL